MDAAIQLQFLASLRNPFLVAAVRARSAENCTSRALPSIREVMMISRVIRCLDSLDLWLALVSTDFLKPRLPAWHSWWLLASGYTSRAPEAGNKVFETSRHDERAQCELPELVEAPELTSDDSPIGDMGSHLKESGA